MIPDLVETLSTQLLERGWMLATAESCTGGLIGAAITDRAGSSSVFDRGFITYSNDSKHELIGVSRETLTRFGAVSAETAQEMVQGAVNHSIADLAVAVTGIAGPGGGSVDKPVGLVFIAWGQRGHPHQIQRHIFSGDRAQIRQQTVETALHHLIDFLANAKGSHQP